MIKSYKPTRREKILIGLVLIFLCGFVSVYYLYLPAVEAHEEMTAALLDARINQTQVMTQVSAVNALLTKAEWAEIESGKGLEQFSIFTQTENIEAELTSFLIAARVKPKRIMISYNETFDPYSSPLIAFTTEISAEGDRDDLLRLPDYLNDRYSYRLTNMSIRDDTLIARAEYKVEMVFMIYGN